MNDDLKAFWELVKPMLAGMLRLIAIAYILAWVAIALFMWLSIRGG